jgi:hypothetical protein
MELVDIHGAVDDKLQRESKPVQEASVAHSGKELDSGNETASHQNSGEPPPLQGAKLILLLSCLFLGNLTIGFVRMLVVQNKIHQANQQGVWTVLTRHLVGQQLHWHPDCDSHRPIRRPSRYWLVPNNIVSIPKERTHKPPQIARLNRA